MAVKRRRFRANKHTAMNGALKRLIKRVEELEKELRDNKRILNVQFERMAHMQAEVDRVRAQLRRDG